MRLNGINKITNTQKKEKHTNEKQTEKRITFFLFYDKTNS